MKEETEEKTDSFIFRYDQIIPIKVALKIWRKEIIPSLNNKQCLFFLASRFCISPEILAPVLAPQDVSQGYQTS